MTIKNNRQFPPDQESDWNNYKMYVVECIKNLTDTQEKIEKRLNDQQLEYMSNIYKIKEDFQMQLKELADTILKLQIRVGIICATITVFITIAANVVARLLGNYIEQ